MSIVSLNDNEDLSANEELSALIAMVKIALGEIREIMASIGRLEVSDPNEFRAILVSIRTRWKPVLDQIEKLIDADEKGATRKFARRFRRRQIIEANRPSP